MQSVDKNRACSREGGRPAPYRRLWAPAFAGALLSFALATSAAAQPKQPTTYDRAIAAGYKALFLCSGMFVAGRTRAQIEAEELRGIYPEYEAIVPTLMDVTIPQDRHGKSVTVAFDAAMQPRIASYVPGKGCTLQPLAPALDQSAGPVVTAIERPSSLSPRDFATDLARDTRFPPLPTRAARSLMPIAQAAFDGASYGERSKTSSLVVINDGMVVAERYADGFAPHTRSRTWSVAKSIAGTIIGAAAHQGLIDPMKPARIPEWSKPDDPRRRITLDSLLRMASGLHSDTAGNRTDDIYFGGTAVTEQAPFWPLIAKPNSRFRYANNDTLLAIRALRAALGDERYARFPREAVFEKVGMFATLPEKDWQGNFILSSQVWSTARDLARFGLLYLNDGVWNGQRILPEGWVNYVTTPSGPQPESGPRYGATFWLFGPEQGLPAGTYAAQGNRGQYVMIVPSQQLVVVRQGLDPHGTRFDIAKFTADVITALDQGA